MQKYTLANEKALSFRQMSCEGQHFIFRQLSDFYARQEAHTRDKVRQGRGTEFLNLNSSTFQASCFTMGGGIVGATGGCYCGKAS